MSQQQQELGMEMEERRVTRTVHVKLSPAERAQCMDEYNQLRDEMETAEKEFGKLQKEHKQSLAGIEEKAEKTRLKAKLGEPRQEDCIEKRFFGQNVVQTWFGDEMIEERAMTYEERQGNLEPQHGVVMEAEEKRDPADAEADLREVMRDEMRADKPSTVM